MENKDNDNIVMSRIAYENILAKDEKNNKFKNVIIGILILLLISTNALWIWIWNKSSLDNPINVLFDSSEEPTVDISTFVSEAVSEETFTTIPLKDSNNDLNSFSLESFPDNIVSYDNGYINVSSSLFEMHYSDLNEIFDGRLNDMTEWKEDDLKTDSVCGFGTVAFKLYDERCVSLVYAYSEGSFDLESLKTIYSKKLGECDYENYNENSGELSGCLWHGSEINVHLYSDNSKNICYVEFESVDSVME